MSVWAILVAAGRGERLGLEQPKAFAKLGEDPLLAEPLRRLEESAWVDAIVLVAPPGWEEPAILLAEELGCGKVSACVPGGETRAESVRAGVAEVPLDAVVVLGAGVNSSDHSLGVNSQDRVLHALELIQLGYAPRLILPGGEGSWGPAVEGQMRALGVKAPLIDAGPASNTHDEANDVANVLKEHGWHRVLLVTSNYHTHRSGSIFRRTAPDLDFLVVSSPDEFYSPDTWWRNRESRKIFLYEWMKTVAEW